MPTQIFVNLPVKNLDQSMAFFASLGFSFNPQFTDQNAACMIVGENIFVMLLMEPYFQTFIPKQICDTRQAAEAILSISIESRKKVDELAEKAFLAGGRPSSPPQDHGWMYQRGFQDLDGHLWEVFFADLSLLPGPQA